MYEQLVADAIEKSDLASRAVAHVEARTKQMRADQLDIMHKNLNLVNSSNFDDVSLSVFAVSVSKYMSEELLHIKAFNQSDYRLDKFQLKFNKMEFIIDNTIKYFGEDESVIASIAHGRMPIVAGYDTSEYDTTLLPLQGTSNFWGGNNATIYSNALLSYRFVMLGESIQKYMHTSIAHVIPTSGLPEEYSSVNRNPRIYGGYPYAYNFNGVTGFGVVHGGYAFGGQRLETVFPPKPFGPEDCSSWVSKLLGSQEQWSTSDLAEAYNEHHESMVTGALARQFSANVKPENIQAGDIYLSRTGNGGHTGVVLGNDPYQPGKAIIVSFSRNMERQDTSKDPKVWGCAGAGIDSFSTLDEGNTRVMFMRPVC